MSASFFDNHIICSHCGHVCDTMALTQKKDERRFEFDGDAIHVECYVRLLVEVHIEKLLDQRKFLEKNQQFMEDIQDRIENAKKELGESKRKEEETK